MVRARFRAPCGDENGKESCARLKAPMRGCKAPDAGPAAAHGHAGGRSLGGVDGALRRTRGLNRLAGRGALDIHARIKCHGRGAWPSRRPSR